MNRVVRMLPSDNTKPTPEWVMVMWFDGLMPDALWAALEAMPDSPYMPVISDDGTQCSLFAHTKNLSGRMRKWSADYAVRGQTRRNDPWLDADVMNDAFAEYARRSLGKDNFLAGIITDKDQYLARPPEFGRNLLGDSTLPAYAKIEGADFLEGYRVMRGL